MKLGFAAMTSKQKPNLRNGSQKLHPHPKKQGSSVQCEKFFFFYSDGVIHHEFVLSGPTVNKEYYLKVVKRLEDAVRRNRADLWWVKSGWSIMTTLRPIPSFWFVIFSQNMEQRSSASLRTH